MNIHHVQLAIPPGGEERARSFWIDILGFSEIPKPVELQPRGGLWLAFGDVEVHLGVQDPFVAASKAHPGFYVDDDLDDLERRLHAAGYAVRSDSNFRQLRRFHVFDPFGNRVEFLGSQPEDD